MGLLHIVTLPDVRKTVKVDSSENMFHIVHGPRFALPAPLKPTFAIGTSDQRFGQSSPTMNIDPVELLTNSFAGNRRVDVRVSFCSELGSCGLMFFGYNPG